MSRQPDADWPPIQFTVAADGNRVAYMHFAGSGPPFLWLLTPGTPPLSLLAGHRTLERFEHFRRGRSLIAFDWRGSGRSGPIDGALTLADLGADLDAAIDVVGSPVDATLPGRACFAVCVHAAHHPGRYRSITIEGGALRAGESWQGLYNRPGWQRDYPEHLRGLAEHYFTLTAEERVRFALQWESGVPASTWASYLESEADVDLTEVLPLIEVPTWVVARLPIDHEPARKMALLLPDSRLSIYEPSTAGAERANRDEWDRQLGAVLGDPPSTPAADPAEVARDDPARISITEREREVLGLIAHGDTNLEIAGTLGIVEGTVKRHVSNLLQKTGLKNRRQLMRFADARERAN